jgi:hypothetical protein
MKYSDTRDFWVTHEFRIFRISIAVGRGGSDICCSPTFKGSACHCVHILVKIVHLTKSMEWDRSWEPDSHSSGEESFRLSSDPKVHWRVYKSPSCNSVPTKLNSVHTLTLFLNVSLILFNTILFGIFNWNLCMHFSLPPYVLHVPPLLPPWFFILKGLF